jgi:hypothetical protein
MLESLSEFPFLFPASAIYAHAVRPNEHNARSGHSVNRDLEDFVSWVNRTFRNSDGTPPIPPDPTKHLHGTRFRRTLAYFIVRRPRWAHLSSPPIRTYRHKGYFELRWTC